MQRRNTTKKMRDITILSDSHGREVAAIMASSEPSFSVVGITKPGAPLKEVLKGCEKILKPGSDCVLIGGANDVYRNENKCAENALREALQKTPEVNYFIVSIPHRHDLTKNSSVNLEIKSMNKSFEEICSGFVNTTFVCANSTVRRHFTRHGLHRNRKGKEAMTTEILKVMKSCTDGKATERHGRNSQSLETNDRSPTAEVMAPTPVEVTSSILEMRSPTKEPSGFVNPTVVCANSTRKRHSTRHRRHRNRKGKEAMTTETVKITESCTDRKVTANHVRNSQALETDVRSPTAEVMAATPIGVTSSTAEIRSSTKEPSGFANTAPACANSTGRRRSTRHGCRGNRKGKEAVTTEIVKVMKSCNNGKVTANHARNSQALETDVRPPTAEVMAHTAVEVMASTTEIKSPTTEPNGFMKTAPVCANSTGRRRSTRHGRRRNRKGKEAVTTEMENVMKSCNNRKITANHARNSQSLETDVRLPTVEVMAHTAVEVMASTTEIRSPTKEPSGSANTAPVCANSTGRRHYTRHGRNKNRKVKEAVTTEILKVMESCTDGKVTENHVQNSQSLETNVRSPTAEVMEPTAVEVMSSTAEIRSLTKEPSGFDNTTLVCADSTGRRHFTRHGHHRNRKGKEAVTTEIPKVMKPCTDRKLTANNEQNSQSLGTNNRSSTAEVMAPTVVEIMSSTAEIILSTEDPRSPPAEARSPLAEDSTLTVESPTLTAEDPTLATEEPTRTVEDPTLAAADPVPLVEDPTRVVDDPSPVADDLLPAAEYPTQPEEEKDPLLAAEDPTSPLAAAVSITT